MKALWDMLARVAPRRLCRDLGRSRAAPDRRAAQAGDTVLVKGSNGSKMGVIIEALKARGA